METITFIQVKKIKHFRGILSRFWNRVFYLIFPVLGLLDYSEKFDFGRFLFHTLPLWLQILKTDAISETLLTLYANCDIEPCYLMISAYLCGSLTQMAGCRCGNMRQNV